MGPVGSGLKCIGIAGVTTLTLVSGLTVLANQDQVLDLVKPGDLERPIPWVAPRTER